VWTDAKRKREESIDGIIDHTTFESWCEFARTILLGSNTCGKIEINTVGMSLELFQVFVMGWLKKSEVKLPNERMPCSLILRFAKKKTIQNAAELKNSTIVSYHGYGNTYTFRISFRGALQSSLNSFTLCIECDWTDRLHGEIEEGLKKTHSCSIVKIPDNVRELPPNLHRILDLFIENN
jgi:hypothetical protein